MEALAVIVPMLLSVSLAGLVLAVGLNATRHDLAYVLTRPGRLGRAILAVMIIPPLAAALLVTVLPLEPVVKASIVLMAVSPVPPLVPGKELAVRARKEYAYGLYVAMALLSVISVPVVFRIAAQLFGRDDSVSIPTIALMVATGVVLPLALGFAIRARAPSFAARAWSVIYKASMVLVLVAFVPVLLHAWPMIAELIGNGGLAAMAAATILAMLGGHLLGGPDQQDRATLAIASSVRHPGIAMALASANFADTRVSAAVLLFLLVGLAVSAPYTAWIKRHPPAHPAPA